MMFRSSLPLSLIIVLTVNRHVNNLITIADETASDPLTTDVAAFYDSDDRTNRASGIDRAYIGCAVQRFSSSPRYAHVMYLADAVWRARRDRQRNAASAAGTTLTSSVAPTLSVSSSSSSSSAASASSSSSSSASNSDAWTFDEVMNNKKN